MHIVYKFIFTERLKNKTPPYYYIGSKSNCEFKNGKIYDNRGNIYCGSLKTINKAEVKTDAVHVELLAEFTTYTNALNYESQIQKAFDVVADFEYYNRAITTVNNFSDPDYATYKHIDTGKTVRLLRNHSKVISGEYVSVSKGTKLSDETRTKISQ
jgi:hypothetical protein